MLKTNYRVIFLIISILLISDCFSYADNIENIENKRQECLNTNFQTDYTMAQCNYTAIKQYDAEIQNIINNLKTVLTKPQYKKLIKSQNRWMDYINKNNALFETTLETKFYFEPYLISSSLKLNNFKQRCSELSDLYKYSNDYK